MRKVIKILLVSLVVLPLFCLAFILFNKALNIIERELVPKPIITLKLLKNESEIYDWHPQFELNVPNFDSKNRPYIRNRTADPDSASFVQTLKDGKWVGYDFIPTIRSRYPDFSKTILSARTRTRIVFDQDDHAYMILKIELKDGSIKGLLLYSQDLCLNWQVYELPSENCFMEYWTGHNQIKGPPPLVFYQFYAPHPAEWADYYSFFLLFPEKTETGLKLGPPLKVCDDGISLCGHSGAASVLASSSDKTHLVLCRITGADKPGTATYIVTYDRRCKELGKMVFLAYAPPINDSHNTPGICLDSQGYIHIITGAHGSNFYYLKSNEPDDVYAGFSHPEPTLTSGWADSGRKFPLIGNVRWFWAESKASQTYVSFICDNHDNLHLAFRYDRQGIDKIFGGEWYGCLAYQRKKKEGKWGKVKPLVMPPQPHYSIYYHQLALNRAGKLYLSYSYYTPDKPYGDLPLYKFRSLLCSGDAGDTWHLATDDDFIKGADQ